MRRFFISPEELREDPPVVTGPEAVHITTVLRLQAGDRIVLFDGTGYHYDAAILSASKRRVAFRILEKKFPPEEASSPVTIAQGILKDRKIDLLARQLTELGVFELLLFSSERSIPNPDKARMKARRKRWDKIVHEAMKQSRRNTPMRIGPFMPFQEIVALGKGYDCRILFWEYETTPLPPTLSAGKTGARSAIAVLGPEGGFNDREVALAREAGFVTASLGHRILKSETAAVTAAALLQFLLGSFSSDNLL